MDEKIAKEIAPGVYIFTEPSGERLLNFYGLKEDKGWTLVDCGLPGSVEYWVKSGSIQGNIIRLIVTHGDADHFGSGAWLKENYLDVKIICHKGDKEVIENHRLIIKKRYDAARPFFGYGYPPETLDALYQACGDDFKVDKVFSGGETFRINGMQWKVIHLPGHSPGHLGLLREEDGIFIFGDAFLADGPPALDGKPSMPPTHEAMNQYIDSIAQAEKLPLSLALSGHWLPMKAEVFMEFLGKSRDTVFRDLNIITTFLKEGEKTFKEILDRLNMEVSTWKESENAHYLYALNGYLTYLQNKGKVNFTSENKVILIKSSNE